MSASATAAGSTAPIASTFRFCIVIWVVPISRSPVGVGLGWAAAGAPAGAPAGTGVGGPDGPELSFLSGGLIVTSRSTWSPALTAPVVRMSEAGSVITTLPFGIA